MNSLFRRISAAISIVSLLAGPLTAAEAKPTRHATHHAVAAKAGPAGSVKVRPALWKVSDKDTTIWLFGTIHALPQGLEWLNGPVAKAFDSSDRLVTEIPDSPPEVLQGVVMKTALLPKGESLHAMLPKADAAALDKALNSYGIPPAAFDQYEPWFVAITMASLPLVKQGYSPANGVEAQLGAKAKAAGRPQDGLETVEYQLGIFDKLPRKVQIRYLREVLKSLPRMKSDLAKLIAYWSAGNPVKLAQMLNADEDDPRMIKLLLHDRNRNWAAWIRNRMASPGTVFIAVGAGHLAGPQSVQARLTAAGYRVTRVQ